MKKVKFGLVGAGNVANYHMISLSSIAEAEITALCDVDKEKLKEAAGKFNIKKLYSDYNELLKDENVDVVEILTPPHIRPKIAIAAAEAGKHIIVEKPMCHNLKDADEMIKAAKNAGVKLMMAESYVFTTTHVKAKELIEAGEIGEPMWIRSVRGSWINKNLVRQTERPPRQASATAYSWRADPTITGGGKYSFFFLHNVHFIAAARYLMGSDVEKVYAMPKLEAVEGKSEGATAREDVSTYTCRYEGGEKFSTFMDFGFTFTGRKRIVDHLGFKTIVSGTEGTIEMFGEGGGPISPGQERAPLIIHKRDETRAINIDEGSDLVWVSVVNYYNQAFKNELDYFANCILKDEKPRYTGEDGRKDVQITLAAIKSVLEDRPIRPAQIPREWTPD